MKAFPFFRTFPVRRIFMRPWRRKLGPPLLVGGSIGALLITFFGSRLLVRPLGLLGSMTAATFLAAALLLGAIFLLPPPGNADRRICWHLPGPRELLLVLAGWLAVLTGSAFLTQLWRLLLESCRIPFETEQTLVQMARSAELPVFFQILLLTAVAVPLTEELIFRRCLPELLAPLGPRSALLLGAFIFAAAHGFLLGLPGLFFIGLIFQILCNVTRNLWCSILCHALLNGSVLILNRAAELFSET